MTTSKDIMSELMALFASERGSKSLARAENSEAFQFRMALKDLDVLRSGLIVVSTTASKEADEELKTLVGEEREAAFNRWKEKFSKPEKVQRPDKKTGEMKERIRAIHVPLANVELHEATFGQVRKAGVGEKLAAVLKLLKRKEQNIAPETILESWPTLREDLEKNMKAPAEKVRALLMTAATVMEIDPNRMNAVFGFEPEPDTVVVVSEETEKVAEEIKTADETATAAKKAATVVRRQKKKAG